jgi:hypothetical protein
MSRVFYGNPISHQVSHTEYPAFYVGENFSPDTAGHMALISIWTATSLRGSQSEPAVVYPRVLYRHGWAARQLLFVEDNARTLAQLVTSNLASLHCCRRWHHASEVQQLFLTRSVSDASWGKVRSLTE